jgi:hypothetical protein
MENPVKGGCLGAALAASFPLGILAGENEWFGPILGIVAAPWLFLIWWGWRNRSASADKY